MIKTLFTLILIVFLVYVLTPSFSISLRFGNKLETEFEKKMKTYCSLKKELKKPVDILPIIA